MRKYLLTVIAAVLALVGKGQIKSFDERARLYIKQYSAWAIEEQQRVGIPASVTLAQGIYETAAGESELATQANNHFGIKCKRDWTGATFAHTDDRPNECFRKYKTAKDSYKDHSDYLRASVRYAELFKYNPADYKAWAYGLKRCGYATNPAYADRLIRLIEDYDLQLYTFAAEGKRLNEAIPGQTQTVAQRQMDPIMSSERVYGNANTADDGSVRYNNLRAVFVRKSESLLNLAMKYNLRYARLLEINELPDAPLTEDMYIYLEPKRLKGLKPYHQVMPGETIERIAHAEGMSARQLRIFNLMAQNEQPQPGAMLFLQTQSVDRPAVFVVSRANTSEIATPVVQSRASVASRTDFVPTNRAVQTQNLTDESVSPRYNAAAAQVAKYNEAPVTSNVQSTPPVPARQGTHAPPPAREVGYAPPPAVDKIPTGQQMQANINPRTGRPYLESELMAQNDRGSLPLNLNENDRPGSAGDDELYELKAKLDRSVYSRSSRSNITVSGNDKQAVYNTPPARTTQAAPRNAEREDGMYHTVAAGETVYSISRMYNVKVKDINDLNGLNFQGVKVGQRIRVR